MKVAMRELKKFIQITSFLSAIFGLLALSFSQDSSASIPDHCTILLSTTGVSDDDMTKVEIKKAGTLKGYRFIENFRLLTKEQEEDYLSLVLHATYSGEVANKRCYYTTEKCRYVSTHSEGSARLYRKMGIMNGTDVWEIEDAAFLEKKGRSTFPSTSELVRKASLQIIKNMPMCN